MSTSSAKNPHSSWLWQTRSASAAVQVTLPQVFSPAPASVVPIHHTRTRFGYPDFYLKDSALRRDSMSMTSDRVKKGYAVQFPISNKNVESGSMLQNKGRFPSLHDHARTLKDHFQEFKNEKRVFDRSRSYIAAVNATSCRCSVLDANVIFSFLQPSHPAPSTFSFSDVTGIAWFTEAFVRKLIGPTSPLQVGVTTSELKRLFDSFAQQEVPVAHAHTAFRLLALLLDTLLGPSPAPFLAGIDSSMQRSIDIPKLMLDRVADILFDDSSREVLRLDNLSSSDLRVATFGLELLWCFVRNGWLRPESLLRELRYASLLCSSVDYLSSGTKSAIQLTGSWCAFISCLATSLCDNGFAGCFSVLSELSLHAPSSLSSPELSKIPSVALLFEKSRSAVRTVFDSVDRAWLPHGGARLARCFDSALLAKLLFYLLRNPHIVPSMSAVPVHCLCKVPAKALLQFPLEVNIPLLSFILSSFPLGCDGLRMPSQGGTGSGPDDAARLVLALFLQHPSQFLRDLSDFACNSMLPEFSIYRIYVAVAVLAAVNKSIQLSCTHRHGSSAETRRWILFRDNFRTLIIDAALSVKEPTGALCLLNDSQRGFSSPTVNNICHFLGELCAKAIINPRRLLSFAERHAARGSTDDADRNSRLLAVLICLPQSCFTPSSEGVNSVADTPVSLKSSGTPVYSVDSMHGHGGRKREREEHADSALRPSKRVAVARSSSVGSVTEVPEVPFPIDVTLESFPHASSMSFDLDRRRYDLAISMCWDTTMRRSCLALHSQRCSVVRNLLRDMMTALALDERTMSSLTTMSESFMSSDFNVTVSGVLPSARESVEDPADAVASSYAPSSFSVSDMSCLRALDCYSRFLLSDVLWCAMDDICWTPDRLFAVASIFFNLGCVEHLQKFVSTMQNRSVTGLAKSDIYNLRSRFAFCLNIVGGQHNAVRAEKSVFLADPMNASLLGLRELSAEKLSVRLLAGFKSDDGDSDYRNSVTKVLSALWGPPPQHAVDKDFTLCSVKVNFSLFRSGFRDVLSGFAELISRSSHPDRRSWAGSCLSTILFSETCLMSISAEVSEFRDYLVERLQSITAFSSMHKNPAETPLLFDSHCDVVLCCWWFGACFAWCSTSVKPLDLFHPLDVLSFRHFSSLLSSRIPLAVLPSVSVICAHSLEVIATLCSRGAVSSCGWIVDENNWLSFVRVSLESHDARVLMLNVIRNVSGSSGLLSSWLNAIMTLWTTSLQGDVDWSSIMMAERCVALLIDSCAGFLENDAFSSRKEHAGKRWKPVLSIFDDATRRIWSLMSSIHNGAMSPTVSNAQRLLGCCIFALSSFTRHIPPLLEWNENATKGSWTRMWNSFCDSKLATSSSSMAPIVDFLMTMPCESVDPVLLKARVLSVLVHCLSRYCSIVMAPPVRCPWMSDSYVVFALAALVSSCSGSRYPLFTESNSSRATDDKDSRAVKDKERDREFSSQHSQEELLVTVVSKTVPWSELPVEIAEELSLRYIGSHRIASSPIQGLLSSTGSLMDRKLAILLNGHGVGWPCKSCKQSHGSLHVSPFARIMPERVIAQSGRDVERAAEAETNLPASPPLLLYGDPKVFARGHAGTAFFGPTADVFLRFDEPSALSNPFGAGL